MKDERRIYPVAKTHLRINVRLRLCILLHFSGLPNQIYFYDAGQIGKNINRCEVAEKQKSHFLITPVKSSATALLWHYLKRCAHD